MKRWQKILLGIVLALSALIGIVPFLIPVESSGTKTEQELADPDSRFIEINGLTIHYKEIGSGDTTFILLHGFGASVYSWREVMEPLAQYGRVIAYDRPAFGLTSRPMAGAWEGESPYSLASNAKLVIDLMDALDVEDAVLVGNSAGGTVSVAAALDHPSRIRALILVDPAVGGEGAPSMWYRPLLETPQMRHLGPLLVRSIADSGDDTIRLAWHDPSKVTDAIIAGYRKPLQAINWESALYEFTIAPRIAINDRLGAINLPVLIVTGDDDRIVPTENSIRLKDDIPASSLIVFPACGHVPQEECPDAFMQAVIEFVQGVSK
jgi:pimeloyl-ACP methyl ester carboxylesterase